MFAKSRFRQRLMMYSILLYIVSIPLTGFLSYYISRDIIYSEVEKVNDYMAKEAAVATDMIFSEVLSALQMVSSERELLNNVGRLGQGSYIEIASRTEMGAQFQNVLESYGNIENICAINGDSMYSISATIASTSAARERMDGAMVDLRNSVVNDKKRSSLSLGTYYLDVDGRIIVYKRLGETLADPQFLAMEVKIPVSHNSQVLGPYVYVYGEGLLARLGHIEDMDEWFREEIIRTQADATNQDGVKVDKGFLCFTKKLNTGQLHLAYFVDMRFTQQEIAKVRNDIVIVAGVSFVIVLFMSLILTNRLNRNVALLKKHMSEADYADPTRAALIPIKSKSKGSRKHLSFKSKTLLYFCATAAVPILIITSIAYAQVRIIIEDRIGVEIQNNISLLSSKLTYMLDSYSNKSFILSINKSLQGIISSSDSGALGDKQKLTLTDILINGQMKRNNIDNVYLYSNEYELLYSLELNDDSQDNGYTKSDFVFLNQNTPSKKWRADFSDRAGRHYIRVGVRIRNIATFEPLGYLFIEYGADQMKDLLGFYSQENGSSILLRDRDGHVLYQNAVDPMTPADLVHALDDGDSQTMHSSEVAGAYYVTEAPIATNGWQITAFTPLSHYTRNNGCILQNNLLILLCAMIMVLSASYRFSHVMSQSVELILGHLVKVQKGILEQIQIVRSYDEIEELGMHYNIMVERIKSLIDEVYVAKIEMADAELKLRESQFNALQAQINPHFLYNTLETIHFMILLGDKNAIKMVQLLGDLFRKGIGKGEKFVQIEQELEHIRLYIGIQQMRYPDKFSVEFDVDEGICALYTIKFLLQPILENAIYHGLELLESDGSIKIIGALQHDRLIIRIIDNGQGIRDDKLVEIVDKPDGRIKSESIGLKNVHERIQLYFGSGYGLRIISGYGQGTEVMILLPVLTEPPA